MSRLAVATARRVARAKHSRRQPVMKKPTFGCPAANRPHPLLLPCQGSGGGGGGNGHDGNGHDGNGTPTRQCPEGEPGCPGCTGGGAPRAANRSSAPATTRWSPVCTRLPPATHKPAVRLACGAGLYPARLQVRSLPQRTRSRREHPQEVKQSALGALGVLLGAIPPRRHPRRRWDRQLAQPADRTSDHRLRRARRGCIRATERS